MVVCTCLWINKSPPWWLYIVYYHNLHSRVRLHCYSYCIDLYGNAITVSVHIWQRSTVLDLDILGTSRHTNTSTSLDCLVNPIIWCYNVTRGFEVQPTFAATTKSHTKTFLFHLELILALWVMQFLPEMRDVG